MSINLQVLHFCFKAFVLPETDFKHATQSISEIQKHLAYVANGDKSGSILQQFTGRKCVTLCGAVFALFTLVILSPLQLTSKQRIITQQFTTRAYLFLKYNTQVYFLNKNIINNNTGGVRDVASAVISHEPTQ